MTLPRLAVIDQLGKRRKDDASLSETGKSVMNLKQIFFALSLSTTLASPALAWGELDVLCYISSKTVVATVDTTTHLQTGILPFPPLGSPAGPVGQIVAGNIAIYGLGSWFALNDEGGTQWWQGPHELIWRNGATVGTTKLTISGKPNGLTCQPYGQMLLYYPSPT